MKENMFDVLMYLFQNHMQGSDALIKEEVLMNELRRAGFDVSEISNALDWLDGLAACTEMQKASSVAFRSLSPEEQIRISAECWGYISYLEQIGILDFQTREIVIDRLMDLEGSYLVDIPHVKWVTLMVLFHMPDHTEALKAMENLVLSGESEQIH